MVTYSKIVVESNRHASKKLTPFEVVYGYLPPSLLAHTLAIAALQYVEEALCSRDVILKWLRENMHVAWERMKRFVDLSRTERSFDMGDMVYLLRIHPYKQ